MADPGVDGALQLGGRLGVAVQVAAGGVDPGRAGQRQLSPRGDVARESLLGKQPVHGGAGERLGGEQHVEVGVSG